MRTTNIAKIEGAINIPKDASWNFPPVRSILGPKKVSKISNIQYINVNKLAIQATIGNKLANPSTEKKLNCFTLSMAVKNISLLKKPLKGGKPAIEKLPMTAIVNESGIKAKSPPSRLKSRVPIR